MREIEYNVDSRGIYLNLCTYGVNHFSHLWCNYSMWPNMLSLINLPRKIGNDFNNILLVGIITPITNRKDVIYIHNLKC